MLAVSEQAFKRCSRCQSVKPITEFNTSKEFGRQFYCRSCQRAWYLENRVQHIANVNANTQRYRSRNGDFVREYLLMHPCVDCGEANPELLEFDHVRDKLVCVAQLMWSCPLPQLIAEIAKCEVRCVNCHFRRTAAQFGWRKTREA